MIMPVIDSCPPLAPEDGKQVSGTPETLESDRPGGQYRLFGGAPVTRRR